MQTEVTKGLSSIQAQVLLKKYGLNSLQSRKPTLLQKLFTQFISPISLMLWVAVLLSFLAHHTFDAYFILSLLLLNIGISLIQEGKADNALELLKNKLKTNVKVLRDNEWKSIEATQLVPGDYIELGIGSVVPADLKIIEAHNLSLDESSITGESLPKEKKEGGMAYSGTYISVGLLRGEVVATGNATEFGKTFLLAEKQVKRSALEKDILSISGFLTKLSFVAVLLLTVVLLISGADFLEIITLDLSLIIAGIPISLPTVMTTIISFGVLALSKKKVIVRRLSALQDLANVDALFTDKTGTLTRNKIAVKEIRAYGKYSEEEVLRYAGVLARQYPEDVINKAIIEADHLSLGGVIQEYIPADSDRKRSTIHGSFNNIRLTLSLGAPQVVLAFCRLTEEVMKNIELDIAEAAKAGHRVLALAAGSHGERDMYLVGLFFLADELRSDSKSTVSYLKNHGIEVRMITGDNKAIASQVASDIGLQGVVIAHGKKDDSAWKSAIGQDWRQAAAFAEVLPADKLTIVQSASKSSTIAVTGDGINDLPAVKSAQVGIAVQNAVGALKETADIVLLGSGIGVIKDAILESRMIFARLYTYSVYRLSESFRLIITITILGIALGAYPLTPIQLILLALLNDVPIIALAWDRVKAAEKPVSINAKKRLLLSTSLGLVGVMNSLVLFFAAKYWLHLSVATIETLYFLKLTVGGHLLIYVAHTSERWWRFLPSKEVMVATAVTQGIATILALSGLFMPAALSWPLVIGVWIWTLLWMQASELSKYILQRVEAH